MTQKAAILTALREKVWPMWAAGKLRPFTFRQFPLREASVQVSEVPGRPGVYRAVSFVRPHFQLDELSVSLRLVAELPQGNRG